MRCRAGRISIVVLATLAIAGAGPLRVARAQPAAAQPAGAQPADAQRKAAAQVLFDEARKLGDAGDFAAACPKYAESLRLDSTMGTKFYLAECLEKTGKIASAWGYYIEVVDAARAVGQKDRETYARERAEALRPRLATMTVRVPDAARAAGLEVKRDGVPLGEAQWGLSIPVDPGEHVVVATAAGKKGWESRVAVTEEGKDVAIEVPALADAPPGTDPRPTPAPALPPPRVSFWSGQRIAGLAVGVVGLAGIGAGTFFGLQAMSRHDESNEPGHCGADGYCTDQGIEARDDAIQAATFSTIGFIAGGVLLAGGAVLFLTAPSASGEAAPAAPRAALRVGPSGVALVGRF